MEAELYLRSHPGGPGGPLLYFIKVLRKPERLLRIEDKPTYVELSFGDGEVVRCQCLDDSIRLQILSFQKCDYRLTNKS